MGWEVSRPIYSSLRRLTDHSSSRLEHLVPPLLELADRSWRGSPVLHEEHAPAPHAVKPTRFAMALGVRRRRPSGCSPCSRRSPVGAGLEHGVQDRRRRRPCSSRSWGCEVGDVGARRPPSASRSATGTPAFCHITPRAFHMMHIQISSVLSASRHRLVGGIHLDAHLLELHQLRLAGLVVRASCRR